MTINSIILHKKPKANESVELFHNENDRYDLSYYWDDGMDWDRYEMPSFEVARAAYAEVKDGDYFSDICIKHGGE